MRSMPTERETSALTNTPVIVLTGAHLEDAEAQIRSFGVSACIEKEFSLHRLGDALRRLIGEPRDKCVTSSLKKLCDWNYQYSALRLLRLRLTLS